MVRAHVAHRQAQRDLDVTSTSGGVDAGGVVDRVGVEPDTFAPDAAALGHAEIGAPPITLARTAAGDADRIVGAVARCLVALRRSADVGADAAEGTTDRPALSGWRSSPPAASPWPWRGRGGALRLFDSTISFNERGKMPPRLGNQCLVVVRQLERGSAERTSLALGKAFSVGSGIDEDVAVIERRAKLIVVSRSMPLPNTSPDMSPTPTAVNSVLVISTSISRNGASPIQAPAR